jgi:hypothetical protein
VPCVRGGSVTSVGSYTRKLIIARFASTGEWCDTAKLIYPSAIPDDIVHVARRERERHLKIAETRGPSTCNCAGCLFPEARGE